MATDLFYYTGTGNALWTARLLAQALAPAAVRPMSRMDGDAAASGAEVVGFVFPVHIWGPPRRVIAFANALRADPKAYSFAVAVNAGQVAATLVRLKEILHARNLTLDSGFGVVMPSNYIPWGGPGPEAEQRRRIALAREKIARIAAVVANRESRPVEKGPLWQNLVFTALNRLAFPRVPAMDRGFWVDGKCDACGVCRTVCPCGNIAWQGDRPVWQHRCEQCLACIQWCPREAIQYGRKTPRTPRYRHPEVALRDITRDRRAGQGTPSSPCGTTLG
jgi:ferredoxin